MRATQPYSFQYSNKNTFIKLKEFIAMVNYNLPKLKAKNAIEWINRECATTGIIPIDLMVRDKSGLGLSRAGFSMRTVLSICKNSPTSFNRYGFIKEDLELYFSINNIDFIFNSDKPLNGDNEKDKDNEIEKLKNEVEKLNKEKEILKEELLKKDIAAKLRLGEFRDNDPLKFAIDCRLNQWGNYDPDTQHKPKKDGIIGDLRNQGFSGKAAEAIEIVACLVER